MLGFGGLVVPTTAALSAIESADAVVLPPVPGDPTAGATTSYLDLVLALTARWLGPRVALRTARILSTDPNPRPQQLFLLPRPALDHPDDAIRKAERWIAENLTASSDTASLADIAGLGRRTFLRRFRSATGNSSNPRGVAPYEPALLGGAARPA